MDGNRTLPFIPAANGYSRKRKAAAREAWKKKKHLLKRQALERQGRR